MGNFKEKLAATKEKLKKFKDEKLIPAKEKASEKVGNAFEWCGYHSGVIFGAIGGIFAVHMHGWLKGRQYGEQQERDRQEQKKDTVYGLALKKAGLTDEEAEYLGGVDELIDLVGKDEVLEWCRRDLEMNYELEEEDET